MKMEIDFDVFGGAEYAGPDPKFDSCLQGFANILSARSPHSPGQITVCRKIACLITKNGIFADTFLFENDGLGILKSILAQTSNVKLLLACFSILDALGQKLDPDYADTSGLRKILFKFFLHSNDEVRSACIRIMGRLKSTGGKSGRPEIDRYVPSQHSHSPESDTRGSMKRPREDGEISEKSEFVRRVRFSTDPPEIIKFRRDDSVFAVSKSIRESRILEFKAEVMWSKPPLWAKYRTNLPKRGQKSKEKRRQAERIKMCVEAVYPFESVIPRSPAEPPAPGDRSESSNGHKPVRIPLEGKKKAASPKKYKYVPETSSSSKQPDPVQVPGPEVWRGQTQQPSPPVYMEPRFLPQPSFPSQFFVQTQQPVLDNRIYVNPGNAQYGVGRPEYSGLMNSGYQPERGRCREYNSRYVQPGAPYPQRHRQR
eukprot:157613_1